MNWKIKYLEKENVLEQSVKGTFNAEDTIDANNAQMQAGQKYNCSKFLVDSSQLVLDVNRSDVFEIPNTIYSNYNLSPGSQFAMVKPKDAQAEAIVDFYIIATKRLGWTAKMFPNRKKALEWLCEK